MASLADRLRAGATERLMGGRADAPPPEPPGREEAPGRVLAQEAGAAALQRGDADRAILVYTQLVEQYGDGDSYLGLGRAAIAAGKAELALDTLRRGSLRLIERGRRDAAICLLEEAAGIAPRDLGIHRRLAATHANAGDPGGAVREHARFIRECVDAGETARAIDELEYARGTLGDLDALHEVERSIWDAPHRPPRDRPAVPTGPAMPSRSEPEAAEECVRAARALISDGKLNAAADVLVWFVASGSSGREVQRLLIDVERALGRPDIATEKAHLLSRLLALDGDARGALEVEQLALAS